MPEDYPHAMVRRRRPPSGHTRPLLLGCAAALSTGIALAVPGASESSVPYGIEGPSRQFGSPHVLLSGRAVLFDEAEDASLSSALSVELQRLHSDLYARDGWRAPFDDRRPLRIYVVRREVDGLRQATVRWVDGGRLAGPVALLDGLDPDPPRIVRELARQIVRATLSAYGAPEDAFLSPALVEALSRGSDDASDDEETRTLAAAPTLDFRAHPSTLGRLWIEEIIRDRGDTAFLRLVWERAASSGEAPLPLMLRMLAEASGPREETILVRSAARLYSAVEAEPGPSRLRRFDLEAGALDTSAPVALSVRHRTFLPDDSQDALRVAWPEDGGLGAAVVRYRDSALPADVVLFGPGDVRRIPLSGVSRVDWVVGGSQAGGREIRAPASCEISRSTVFTGLEARAAAGPERSRLTWKTASHDGLWGWAIFREELLPDGRVARTGPEIVPSSERSEDSFGYVFVDSATTAGTFYRYTVWAVTDEGLLAHAFAITLRAGD
jgi:hypothetical protein